MRLAHHLLAPILTLSIGAGAVAQTVPAPPPVADGEARADDIVVTARRSGVPVWLVRGPRTTVVLVGSIERVAPGTAWDPAALDAALGEADRILFPDAVGVSFGLFSAIGLIGKWRAQGSLPRGETLQAMTTPAEWARLVALREAGILKPGFERRHPFHLAVGLSGRVRDRRRAAAGADDHVRRYLRRNKAKRVAVPQTAIGELTDGFFASAPASHVPCLMGVVAAVEAGAAGLAKRAAARDARSRAWAERRVADAVAAAPDDPYARCWPRDSALQRRREAALRPTIRALLDDPRPTLAVVPLEPLARRGGVLDALVAAGFDVRGPRWSD